MAYFGRRMSPRRELSLVLSTIFLFTFLASPPLFAEEAVQPTSYGEDYIDPIPEGADQAPPLTSAEQEKLARFSEPSEEEIAQLDFAGKFGNIDPNREVPDALLEKALAFYNKNYGNIDNKEYLTIVDFSSYSGKARMFIINMRSGKVLKLHVAHGSGSDPENKGVPSRFSNRVGSKASSLGYYRTAETYDGKHDLSLRLDGLSSTNSNVRKRSVVIHGAGYVEDSDKKAGRSAGCLAVSMASRTKVVNMLKEGSIIYAGLSTN